jgi:hypothetical protein
METGPATPVSKPCSAAGIGFFHPDADHSHQPQHLQQQQKQPLQYQIKRHSLPSFTFGDPTSPAGRAGTSTSTSTGTSRGTPSKPRLLFGKRDVEEGPYTPRLRRASLPTYLTENSAQL